jgi:hypothetical protein
MARMLHELARKLAYIQDMPKRLSYGVITPTATTKPKRLQIQTKATCFNFSLLQKKIYRQKIAVEKVISRKYICR